LAKSPEQKTPQLLDSPVRREVVSGRAAKSGARAAAQQGSET
jgi:hypothetical protein